LVPVDQNHAYKVYEVPMAGYTSTLPNANLGDPCNLIITGGQIAACKITNNDQPAHLTLVKVVTNNNGGSKTVSDFPLTATGPSTITGVSGAGAVPDDVVNAG